MTALSFHPMQPVSPRARWHALALTVAIEALVVTAVLVASGKRLPTESFIELPATILAAAPPMHAPPPEVRKPVAEPRRAKDVASAPPPPTIVELAPAPALPIASEHPAEVPAHDAIATPVAAPPVTPPPPPAPSGPSVEYIAKVRAAVQEAFEYPPAARALDFKGRARVAFSLMDGRSSGARIVVSSGMGIVDRAALRAVEGASYPAAPESMQHVAQAFEVWVNFGL